MSEMLLQTIFLNVYSYTSSIAMDIKTALLVEHSKAQTDKIATYIGADSEKFAELVELFLANEYTVTQRAAAVLNVCGEKHSALIAPYWEVLLHNLSKPNLHDAVKRNTMRLLQFTQLEESLYGLAIDICFQYLQSQQEAIAIKVFAMTVLANFLPLYPELKGEFKMEVERQYPYQSTGFKNRASKLLAKL